MMSGSHVVEAFDDGTPLSFYRQQVRKLYGSGGGGGGSYMKGGGGYMKGNGGGGKQKYKMPSYQQLFKNSLKYPNIMMGGGFMKDDPFGPMGEHTSTKWRGYGRILLKQIKESGDGGYGGNDRLTNVHVIPSGASDEYNDSYLTMIADSIKHETLQNY
ncbi:hypothetical protein BLA29_003462 [Euroglyphus maynei]|uniref:Uncharacterized protein n=1 Tax=Euroglyphus maynei TaxID=6958 RepID=A0A1Y3AKT8_EURMA|nr:hypothetical protein BLA29_003462 [Euroglyphus maynei]